MVVEVLLCGLGAVGSWLGFFLGINGVHHFRILDMDHVTLSNLNGRSIYRTSDIHKPKTQAFGDITHLLISAVKIQANTRNFNLMTQNEIITWSRGSSLAVCAMDSPLAMERFNRIFYHRIPCVYVGMQRGGKTGFIIFTHPGTPCVKCSLGLDSFKDLHQLRGEPALPLDIQKIAREAATVGLALLSSDSQSSDLYHKIDREANFIFLSNEGNEEKQFFKPQKNPDCPICGLSGEYPYSHAISQEEHP
ncbi:hypothetical protein BVY01_05290 [bacterium I07]|nr:hypothetical protein BVY01_05290 [bacterium I07]